METAAETTATAAAAAPSPPAAATTAGDDCGDAAVQLQPPEQAQPPPITNAILSQAVTSAISELDTKRAFDMMLLNEQMRTLEAETKVRTDEAVFLKAALATHTQETSEMYHYFHGKMDSHVATIAALETQLAAAQDEIERLHESHEAALASAQQASALLLAKSVADADRLKEELAQLHAFATQKTQLETRTRELETQLEANAVQFAAEKHALELKAMFEKDRLKKEMLTHMKETKEALLLRTDEQLNTTTKRTMMENDHFMDELSFQSKETEKLLVRFRTMEDQVQRLRVHNKMLEENETAMAKKNHYYQKLLSQLKRQRGELPKTATMVDGDGDGGDGDATSAKAELLLAEKDAQIEQLGTRVATLEESQRHAQQWIAAFQQEKQFVVAQQDEIIQFLCRVLDDATQQQQQQQQHHQQHQQRCGEEHELSSPRIPLDELDSDATRDVLSFLLNKMQLYQRQVAMVYQTGDTGASPTRQSVREATNRELLTKQLGVELPPIAPPPSAALASVTSPLKVKRRIQPYATTVAASTATASRAPPGRSSPDPAASSPHSLLTMATSHFNFLQSTPSTLVKSPVASCHKKRFASSTSTSSTTTAGQPPSCVPKNNTRAAGTELPGATQLLPSPLAGSESQPSAWSTDSLPKYHDPAPAPARDSATECGGSSPREQLLLKKPSRRRPLLSDA